MKKWIEEALSPQMLVAYAMGVLAILASYTAFRDKQTELQQEVRELRGDMDEMKDMMEAFVGQGSCSARFHDEVMRRLNVPRSEFPCVPSSGP